MFQHTAWLFEFAVVSSFIFFCFKALIIFSFPSSLALSLSLIHFSCFYPSWLHFFLLCSVYLLASYALSLEIEIREFHWMCRHGPVMFRFGTVWRRTSIFCARMWLGGESPAGRARANAMENPTGKFPVMMTSHCPVKGHWATNTFAKAMQGPYIDGTNTLATRVTTCTAYKLLFTKKVISDWKHQNCYAVCTFRNLFVLYWFLRSCILFSFFFQKLLVSLRWEQERHIAFDRTSRWSGPVQVTDPLLVYSLYSLPFRKKNLVSVWWAG